MIDYSYLSPPTKVTRIRLPTSYIYENVRGKHIRRIFTRSQYESFESEAIAQLKQYLKRKAPNVFYPDELLLRFNYLANFLLSDAIERVRLYDEWHQNEVITTLVKPGREILEHGHIYAYGRDYEYCPVVVVRPNQFDFKLYQAEDYLNATANLLDPLEKYMLVGGVVEKWSVLVDLEGRKCTLNLETVMKNLGRIANAYPYRLKRLWFLNTHKQNEAYIQQVSSYLKSSDSEAEVEVVGDPQQLTRFVAVEERERKYGGSLPNLCEFWPIHTTNKYEETESVESETEYKSAMNDPLYFDEARSPLCDFSSCQIY